MSFIQIVQIADLLLIHNLVRSEEILWDLALLNHSTVVLALNLCFPLFLSPPEMCKTVNVLSGQFGFVRLY